MNFSPTFLYFGFPKEDRKKNYPGPFIAYVGAVEYIKEKYPQAKEKSNFWATVDKKRVPITDYYFLVRTTHVDSGMFVPELKKIEEEAEAFVSKELDKDYELSRKSNLGLQ